MVSKPGSDQLTIVISFKSPKWVMARLTNPLPDAPRPKKARDPRAAGPGPLPAGLWPPCLRLGPGSFEPGLGKPRSGSSRKSSPFHSIKQVGANNRHAHIPRNNELSVVSSLSTFSSSELRGSDRCWLNVWTLPRLARKHWIP